MISTPKGFNFFHELFHYSETDPQWRSFHYDYTGSPFLDEKEIENLRRTLDPIQFATEYLASFKESGSSVFYCFDRKTHVAKDLLPFQEGETVYACIDFNVGLQCTSTFALRGGQIHILEEFKGHPDTETLAQVLKERYKGHKIVAFPDPSGRARKTSAPVGRTDFSILASAGIECLAHQKAPPVTDSVAAVNRKLKTASGAVGLYVSANCTGVITSLERTRWVDNKPDVAIIDKSDSVEHFSDGLRYGIEYLFPITANTRKTSRGFGF
jgi:hypothetical protein